METRSCIQNSDFQKVVCLILLEGNLSTFICWKPVYHDRLIFTYYNVTMFQLCCTQRRIPGEYPAAADVRGGAGVLGPGPGDSSTRPRSGTWRGCCWAWPSTGPSSPSGIQPTRISSGPNHHWCDPLRVPDISSGDTYLVSRKVVGKIYNRPVVRVSNYFSIFD